MNVLDFCISFVFERSPNIEPTSLKITLNIYICRIYWGPRSWKWKWNSIIKPSGCFIKSV